MSKAIRNINNNGWTMRINIKLKRKLFKIVNLITTKKKNSFYIAPLMNCKEDKYDLLNCASDNALYFVNYLMKKISDFKINIILEVFHPERISEYEQYVSQYENVSIKFVLSQCCFTGIKRYITVLKNAFLKSSCLYWIVEGTPDISTYLVKNQKNIDLGYFASCKSDYIYKNIKSSFFRSYCTKKNTVICSTSFLDSIIKSSAYGVPMECFLPIGMPRNDLLGNGIIQQNAKAWLDKKKFSKNTKVILYAPTYRDYESITDVHMGCEL